MKKIITFLLLVSLVSCGKSEININQNPINENQNRRNQGSVELTGSDLTGSVQTENPSSTGMIFSDSQIKFLLSKIEKSTKKQEELEKSSTGILIQGDFKAEFIPSENNLYDKLKITSKSENKIYPLPYNLQNKNVLKDHSVGDSEVFLNFDGFSPNKYYIQFTTWVGGYGSKKKYLLDISNGKTALEIPKANKAIWIQNGKRYIFTKEFEGIKVTKPGYFPDVDSIGGAMIFSEIYADENYIYGIGYNDMNLNPKYLKIYDIKDLKETFSKEIE